ncbi:MAG TPA: HlyD family efflux transporter periplasmic adaptor subunit, partial [Solirubrobacteraceae bacterium]|nr:HlyD family efflux transporter periplasmic adaptor subunit [Solirubrobacteraceae bacterium]
MTPAPRSPAESPPAGPGSESGDGRSEAADGSATATTEQVGAPAVAPAAAERRSPRWRRVLPVAAVLVLLGAAVGGYFAWQASQRVKIDDATVDAPLTTLTAHAGGDLKTVYASVGDMVRPYRPLARVGNEVITSDVSGRVVSISQDVGAFIPPGTTVVTLINPGALRADGQIEEDKGLADLRLGQRAVVKVDAFGGRKFPGVVEEISDQPHQQSINFSITDKRQTQKYDVKVRLIGRPDPGL